MLIAIGRNLIVVLATVVAVGVSVAVWPVVDAGPEAELNNAGARLTYAFDGTLLIGASLEGATFGDEHAVIAAKLPTLQRVSLAGSHVTQRGIRSLRPLDRLGYLNLNHTRMTLESVDEIAQLTSLKELSMEGCDWLQDKHVAQLSSLPNLEMLNLSATSITAESLEHLQGISSLKCLVLNHCSRIDDTAIDSLIQFCLPRPMRISLSWTEITRLGLARLRDSLPNTLIHLNPETMVGLRGVGERGQFMTNAEGEIVGFRYRRHLDGWISELETGDLAVVSGLPGIKRLNLDFTSLTDDLLLQLGPMPQLESLRFTGTFVTDRGLTVLERLPNLKSLHILESDIAGTGFENLRFVPHLHSLRIQSRVGDEILPFLANLTELRTLSIHAPLTDAGIEQLSTLQNLKSLELVQTRVRRTGLETLASLPSLTELSLEGGLVDDSDVETLCQFQSIGQIVLTRTQISHHATNQLKTSLPHAKIFWTESNVLPRDSLRQVARSSR